TAIKLTTALYYTPNGHSIQATGITPDILDEFENDDDQRVREADLNRHIANGKKGEKKPDTEKAAQKSTSKPKNEKSKKNTGPIEFGSSEDQLLTQAMNYFKGITTPSPEKKDDKSDG
ncbi:MAG TPA: S41 family peptidase, partial [Nitrosomonas sp.]|nr:S41 family peptidase [Nitrosomonas sp.]